MAWWDDDEDVLGEGPANKLEGAWRTLLARRAEHGRGLPTMQEAFDSFAAALRVAGYDARLGLWRDRECVREFDGSAAVADVQAAFAGALEPIAGDYRRQTGRAPRATELAKTMDFILGSHPQAYLADATADTWRTLRLRSL